MRTGLTKREKTTDIWFDEKDPLIAGTKPRVQSKNAIRRYLCIVAPLHPYPI